jgi:hypothetical protein
MKILLLSLLLTGTAFSSASSDISMLGIKIHENASALKNVKLEVVAKEKTMMKFRTANGNDFSVTTKNGKIVYMENDWLQGESGKTPLFSNFRFGETSLHDIRKAFGTNGFTHKNHEAFSTDKEVIEFNCFEIDSPNKEIFATVTTVPIAAKVNEENVADSLKLAAVILCDKAYLDEIWGKQKLYDSGNYKKIKPGF